MGHTFTNTLKVNVKLKESNYIFWVEMRWGKGHILDAIALQWSIVK